MTEGRPGHHAYWGLSDGRSPGRINCLKNACVPPSRELCVMLWFRRITCENTQSASQSEEERQTKSECEKREEEQRACAGFPD